jgi:hypothetical protein
MRNTIFYVYLQSNIFKVTKFRFMYLNFHSYRWFVKVLRFLMVMILLISSVNFAEGQKPREEPPPLRDRIFFGGSFGLQLGTYTSIEINPVIGVWLLPRLSIAAGPGYEYIKYQNISTSIYSVRGYLQFAVLKDIDKFIPLGVHSSIVFHAEDELLNLDSEYWQTNIIKREDRFFVNSLLIGGGLSQQIGRKGSFNILVLWVVTDSGYDIYNNPEFRIGFTF